MEGRGAIALLTCDPEHGSLGRVQDGASLDLPLGALMSGEVPGQRVPRRRGRRARLHAVVLLVGDVRRGRHGAVEGRVPRAGALTTQKERKKKNNKGGENRLVLVSNS